MRILSLILLLFLLSACNPMGRYDRVWIPNDRYQAAQALFNKTGSLDLTEQSLREDPTWREQEIREAIYRLTQEYNLNQNPEGQK